MKKGSKKRRQEQDMQLEFRFDGKRRGGKRKGAGRKKSDNSGVSHCKRDAVKKGLPIHVTMKLQDGLPELRKKDNYNILIAVFIQAQKESFRIVHFSVQDNHIHLLVEADDTEALTRGMIGLTVRISKNLNREWGRSGSVFADRYHSRVLHTPTEVRNVLLYVLNNIRHHIEGPLPGRLDPRSSAAVFDGWKEVEAYEIGPGDPVVAAHGWLLTKGWRRAGGAWSILAVPGRQQPQRRRRSG
jgi:REP element-mobilizing transposase RayT